MHLSKRKIRPSRNYIYATLALIKHVITCWSRTAYTRQEVVVFGATHEATQTSIFRSRHLPQGRYKLGCFQKELHRMHLSDYGRKDGKASKNTVLYIELKKILFNRWIFPCHFTWWLLLSFYYLVCQFVGEMQAHLLIVCGSSIRYLRAVSFE